MTTNCPLTRPRASRAAASFVITVPHASGALPHWLDHLAGSAAWTKVAGSHHALDRHVKKVAAMMAAKLGAPLIEGGFSRLVLDQNRALDHEAAIIPVVDDNVLPFNRNMDRGDLAARRGVHRAFHEAVENALAEAPPGPVYLIDQHSFDRRGPSPVPREVDIGVCAPGETEFALLVLDALRQRTTPRSPRMAPDIASRRINVRLDEPYSAGHPGAYIMRRHMPAARGGVVLEICDDLIATDGEAKIAACLLTEAVAAAAEAHRPSTTRARSRKGGG